MKIVIISPVRDEETYIPVTISCMVRQTMLPAEWIIVNDGSRDNTEAAVSEGMEETSFMKYVSLPDRGYRKPGQGVIEAFYEGLKRIEERHYEVVAKFDGDLEFPSNTLETVSKAFDSDPRLGVTGPTRFERASRDKPFRRVLVPKGFVGGPCKFYRKECFEDIGGLIPRAGWDGVDTIRANMKGWRTGELESLQILHLKATGTSKGEGLARACEKYGDVSYYMGGYFWYFLLRVIGRSFEGCDPRIGYYMLKGYFKSRLKNATRESKDFRRYLKGTQIQNIAFWIQLLIGCAKFCNGRTARLNSVGRHTSLSS